MRISTDGCSNRRYETCGIGNRVKPGTHQRRDLDRDSEIDGSKGGYSQSHITSELARFKRGEATYSYA